MRTAGRFAFVVSLALTPVSAWAVDVSNAKITCNTLSKVSAALKPASVNGGTATATTIKVKGKLDGCTVTGAAATVLSGSFGGTLNGTSNDCGALLGANATPGVLTFKWKADPSTPLDQKTSTVNVGTTTGGIYAPTGFPAGSLYGKFQLGVTGVTGAFTGGDGGVTSSNVAVTQEDLSVIQGTDTNGCGNPKGLKKINIGIGTITLQ